MACSRCPATNRAVPSLIDLFLRLEAATSRLEDIATSVATFDQSGSPASHSTNAIVSPARDAAGSSPQPDVAAAPTPPPKAEAVPVEVEGFDKLMSGELDAFIKLSDALDPLLGQQASLRNPLTAAV
jgi:adenylyl cyclase-associated protein